MLKTFKLILFIILSISSIKAHSGSSSSSAGISTALFAGTVFVVTVGQQYNKPTVKKNEALELAQKAVKKTHTQLDLPQQSPHKNLSSLPPLITYTPEWHFEQNKQKKPIYNPFCNTSQSQIPDSIKLKKIPNFIPKEIYQILLSFQKQPLPLLITYTPEWHLENKINLDHLPSDYQYIEENEDNNDEDENDYLKDLKYFLTKA